ncbi:MAG: tetratricopeptide repeat protein [Halioglobus sp.]
MSVLRSTVNGLGLCALVLLNGCSIYSLPGDEQEPVTIEKAIPAPPPTTSPQPKPAPVEPSTSSAYQGLINKADQASAQGDYEQALALLERAQRIDPDSAEIYLNLAKTYRAKGDNSQASATAERGLLYCSGQTECDSLRAYIR